jgi:hypothetical protein
MLHRVSFYNNADAKPRAALQWAAMDVTERRRLHMRMRTIEAAMFLVAARFLRGGQAILPVRTGRIACPPRTSIDAIAIAKAMQSAARHLPIQTTCLDRSRALYWMLRAHGCPAELRIGARQENGTLTAHAWVEYDGVPLLDDEAQRFTVLSSADAARD